MLKTRYSVSIFGEVGVDEAGRGCLAGPVVAACVLFPPKFDHFLINDSKKLTNMQRKEAKSIILDNVIDYGIGFASAQEIDAINILKASFLAMHRALDGLKDKPDSILVDGNRFSPYHFVPYNCIIKGDSKFLSIAAASILAKETRDDFMKEQSLRYPEYGWEKNMGYPTKHHRNAILKYGTTPLHRMTFRLF